jgi:hypothetical protein
MITHIPQATQRKTSMNPLNSDPTQDTPKIAINGQITSPTTTPSANGHAERNPPAKARAIKATQTGPGVRNSTNNAPA